jgi:hypothetical protein
VRKACSRALRSDERGISKAANLLTAMQRSASSAARIAFLPSLALIGGSVA